MGLPGREHIELSGDGKHVMRHSGTERLQMPVFRAVEAELAIKTVGIDLGWHLQKDHPGKAAAVGMGGVVVTCGLAIEPEINHLQAVATGNPGASTLGRLTVHHVADPTLASRQKVVVAEVLHSGLLRPQFALLTQLTRQLRGCIGARIWIGQNALTQCNQLLEQRIRQGAPQDGAGKQIENVHQWLVFSWHFGSPKEGGLLIPIVMLRHALLVQLLLVITIAAAGTVVALVVRG